MNVKSFLASSLHVLNISPLLLNLQTICMPRGYIRAINYHGTAEDTAANFERQLEFFAEYYTPVSLTDLDLFFLHQSWDNERPGLIISFDDGLSSNYSVAASLLDKFGFHGWFFVPVDFIAAAPSEQLHFANTHDIMPDVTSLRADQVAMSWAELRDLDQRHHIVGCHTRSHLRMIPGLPNEVLEYEISSGKQMLEASLGHDCDCFCWVGGEEGSYSPDAAKTIRKAGYRYSFTTNSFPITPDANPHRLERNNIESSWPLALTSFQINGLQDMRYAPKRRRVARTIQAP